MPSWLWMLVVQSATILPANENDEGRKWVFVLPKDTRPDGGPDPEPNESCGLVKLILERTSNFSPAEVDELSSGN